MSSDVTHFNPLKKKQAKFLDRDINVTEPPEGTSKVKFRRWQEGSRIATRTAEMQDV